MITYTSMRPSTGAHVSKFDRWALLTRYRSLVESHDALIACGHHASEQAHQLRRAAHDVLIRLGVSSGEIHKAFSATGPMPVFDARETCDPADDAAWEAAEAEAQEREGEDAS